MSAAITGVWLLTGTFALNSEVPFVGEEPKPGAVEEWLGGNSDEARDQLKAASGLRLTITDSDTFTEEKFGNPQITWFDSEGVLDSEVTPFNGKIRRTEGKAYLLLHDAPLSETIRYDDGDTKIGDTILPIDGGLLRTVSVVTDELYLDRVLLRYEKEAGSNP